MRIRLGIEMHRDGQTLAWALDHPGLFSSGAGEQAALDAFPAALTAYAGWINAKGGTLPFDPASVEHWVDEVFKTYQINQNYELADEGYEVNAFFRMDWKMLSAEEIASGLQLLAWTRQDLLDLLRGVDQQALSVKHPGERWDISGILRHLGGAEWWYLDRLGLAFPQADLAREPFARLEQVRQRLIQVFPTLAGVVNVLGVDGEVWSPRKLLRRTVWHELDHIGHIRRLLSA